MNDEAERSLIRLEGIREKLRFYLIKLLSDSSDSIKKKKYL